MKMLILCAAALISNAAAAQEGSLQTPILLELDPSGAATVRDERIEAPALTLFYRFTLPEWADVSIELAEREGDFAFWLSGEEEFLFSLFGEDHPLRQGPLELTLGPGDYLMQVDRRWSDDALSYRLEARASETLPRAPERGGERYETALNLEPPAARPLEVMDRTDAGGGFFRYAFEVEGLSRVAIAVDAGGAPSSLQLRDQARRVLSSTDFEDAGTMIAPVVEPGRYDLRVDILRGQTNFAISLSSEAAEPIPQELRAGGDAASAAPLGALGSQPLRIEGRLREADQPLALYAFSLDAPAVLVSRWTQTPVDGGILSQVVDLERGLPDGLAMPRPGETPNETRFELDAGDYHLRILNSSALVDYSAELILEPLP